ncbi:hypothetical protein ASD01_29700 [Ensifer sp. Root423]|uniref:hypothetical protein n=1 Tax=Ensifer sp. Root423 TaxID=1736534 RepID=UPI000712A781|nr:hypothetical protein [Ensifer sp. Root423]KQX20990.1 hypothetical protein ASD01_29700 [Ensifer sp. Root423]
MSYLTAVQVRERYKISEMTLWRYQQDKKLNFPKPLIVKRRKLFDEQKLMDWERERAAGSA